ncbi:hypothetical protein [Rhizobium sp. IBUN]|uniref:sunset domain-containing protein n=1 Tax=Rhizobium sp. IBUN TaxID=1042326 RepID=UPI000471C258|nr:hypothetical protein [Rhizobium sp. IBUN]
MKFSAVVALTSAAAFLGSGGYTLLPESVTAPIKRSFVAPTQPMIIDNGVILQRGTDCNIKGNVSIDSGERIYHVPGQHYYEATKISPQYGERWFCSEQEARAAGWRKAGY